MRTRVGYAGGTKKAPTYRSLGDHTETIQIDYDPARISYRELLDIFWENHTPTSKSWSRQYMAAVFYHNESQKKEALESKEREALKRKARIHTQILPYTDFHMAEDYHQKYRLKGEPELLREFQRIYPAPADFVNSTAAARVNGYLGGFGTVDDVKADLSQLGLSSAGNSALLQLVRHNESR